MDGSSESLVEMERVRWSQLKASFKGWWPHGVPGYYAMDTLIEHPDIVDKFQVQIFCPFGEIESGIVAFIDKGALKEVVVLTNNKNNSNLEEALATTKRINWKDQILCMPYADCDVITIRKNLYTKIGLRDIHSAATIKHFLDKNSKPFQDLKYPENTYVGELKLEHIEQVDYAWPHRYKTSPKFFEVIIQNHLSYGVFDCKDQSLLAWMVINEVGFLTHLYVEENHRKKGLAEFLVKYVSNDQLRKGRDVYCYIIEDNIASLKLFRKLNYEIIGRGVWMYVSTSKDLKMSSIKV